MLHRRLTPSITGVEPRKSPQKRRNDRHDFAAFSDVFRSFLQEEEGSFGVDPSLLVNECREVRGEG